MSEEYDLVTIGAGSGGVRASRLAAGLYGAKVAVIELPFGFVSSDSVGGAGGTCVIRGCVPKKLMVYASEFAEQFHDAQGFGWAQVSPPVDVKKLIASKAKEVERLNGVYGQILSKAGVEVIEGRGVVLDPHTVEVRAADGSVRQLKTKRILVATGGRAVKPPIPGAELGITSDEALVLDNVPPGGTMIIVGAGYIAVEFAGIFNGLGYDTHLVVRGDLPLRGFDEECRQVVRDNMEKRGIHLHFHTNPTKLERNADGGIDFHFYDNGTQSGGIIKCAQAMFATGRAPNTRGIGLEARCGCGPGPEEPGHSGGRVPSIWAIGDCTNRMNLTPVALMEGKALVATLFGGKPSVPDYENVPTAVFCQPPLGTVGLTEPQAIERLAGQVDVYISKFKPMKNTLSGRDERTFMKMIVHVQTNRVVGCHMVSAVERKQRRRLAVRMNVLVAAAAAVVVVVVVAVAVGPDAAEIMQGLGIALKCHATKAQFDSCVGIHPSAAEEWVTMSTPARRVECKGKHAEPTGADSAGYKGD
ncbi:hypothetical protein CHLNCDRAFT_137376 [Chlorella variabilis]|uniref:glutathione-disulfide reductase n=1 Tax=Chlorella variabilis TaxID=554065 RepID=E1ZMA6_CHLVA|nr:hypothetical protein CHLNCDRAFT_137376 [Chlorella variabilis]EFN53075.1 hypothetical protein CHLNCDRAFT_137376 [Chlorella variabilis]|eukprot:XP_005845177.1 hypothetical protein CHLNCDRAFT_137376 [Chlorella variabilis]